MSEKQQLARILIIGGAVMVLAGMALLIPGSGLGNLGRLPGDIRIENPRLRFYFPIVTCILLSIFLSFMMWIFRKLF